jgi:hypothetical protein
MEGIRTSYFQPSEMMAFWRGKNERLVHEAQIIHYALSTYQKTPLPRS